MNSLEKRIKKLNLKILDLHEQLEFKEDIMSQMQALIDSLRYRLKNEQEFRETVIRYLMEPDQYEIIEKNDELPF